jgi:O-antigen ligase
MKRLLWVLCVNGGLLALEGVLQRGSGTNRLLWLVEPRLNNTADAQFGPYAYRSNGAQYLTLLWPVALGFWWVSQHAAGGKGRSRSRQHLLIPCAVTMAAAPLISLSRAGAIIGLAAMMTAGVLLIFAQGGSGWKGRLAFTALLGAVLGLGWYAIWPEMSKRVGPAGKEFEEGRLDVWRRALEMRRDYALFGSGPNTFEPVYQFYSPQLKEGDWPAQLHNDWLEMLITFGSVGFSLILLLLMLALGRWFLGGGIHSHRVFVMFLWLGLGATLAHGAVDFPFRIYSIFFLFLIVCAVLSCLGRRHRG